MVEELGLQVKDVNYDDSVFYQNLYNHLSTEYAVLFAQYNNLLRAFNFVKDCYVATLAQINDFVTERIQICRAIEECHAVINPSRPLWIPLLIEAFLDLHRSHTDKAVNRVTHVPIRFVRRYHEYTFSTPYLPTYGGKL